MKIHLAPVLALPLAFALACGFGGESSEETPAAPAAPAASTGAIGVKECDDYIAKVDACLAKLDPNAKAAFEANVKPPIDGWRAAAANPAGAVALTAACQSAATAFQCPDVPVPAQPGVPAAGVPVPGAAAVPGAVVPGAAAVPGAAVAPAATTAPATATAPAATTAPATSTKATETKTTETKTTETKSGTREAAGDKDAANMGRTRPKNGGGGHGGNKKH